MVASECLSLFKNSCAITRFLFTGAALCESSNLNRLQDWKSHDTSGATQSVKEIWRHHVLVWLALPGPSVMVLDRATAKSAQDGKETKTDHLFPGVL